MVVEMDSSSEGGRKGLKGLQLSAWCLCPSNAKNAELGTFQALMLVISEQRRGD